MNYNFRLEMERVRNVFVSQVEVASVGIARRKRIESPDFDTAIKDVKKAHDDALAEVQAYFSRSTPAAPATHPSEVKASKPAVKKVVKKQAKAKQKSASAHKPAPKSKPRQFADAEA